MLKISSRTFPAQSYVMACFRGSYPKIYIICMCDLHEGKPLVSVLYLKFFCLCSISSLLELTQRGSTPVSRVYTNRPWNPVFLHILVWFKDIPQVLSLILLLLLYKSTEKARSMQGQDYPQILLLFRDCIAHVSCKVVSGSDTIWNTLHIYLY